MWQRLGCSGVPGWRSEQAPSLAPVLPWGVGWHGSGVLVARPEQAGLC